VKVVSSGQWTTIVDAIRIGGFCLTDISQLSIRAPPHPWRGNRLSAHPRQEQRIPFEPSPPTHFRTSRRRVGRAEEV
jgi:hypothetical protein